MSASVTSRGRTIATLRFVAVRLMETAASWTPTSPEIEFKVMLGRHIWDFAQHADALGKRTFELRLPPQHSIAPAPRFAAALGELAALEDSQSRLSALYAGALPVLSRHVESYLADSDPILDQPSRVILERIRSDFQRMISEAEAVARELGLPGLTAGNGVPSGLETAPLVAEEEAAAR